MEKKRKKKRASKGIIIFLIVVSILIILSGTYLLYLSNPKRIFGQGVNNIVKNINNIDLIDTGLSNYTSNINLELNANGDLKEYKHGDSFYYDLISNIINNYSKTDINMEYTKNLNDKKLFIKYDSKVNDENLLTGKYLIKNNTEYYHINGYTPNYINNGNNTYFESINKDTKELDNIKYLNKCVGNSLKKEIDIDYFKKTFSSKYTIVTLELNDDRLNRIYRDVINDLKNDKRAKTILLGYDRDFFKNHKKSIKFLDKNESIYIKLYTDNFLYSIYKYEFIDKDKRIVYSNDKFELYKKNKYSINGKIINSKNRLNISFNNDKGKKIGNLNLTKKKNSKKLVFYIKDNKIKNNINIAINKYQIKNNKYKKDIKIILSGVDNGKDIYSVRSIIKEKVSKPKKIKDDTSKSLLNSSLSHDIKEKIENKKRDITKKIEVNYEKKEAR